MSEKFSDFIRAPGTAGPPTQEGIAALGFVLNGDVPGILSKYVRVDAAQSFTGGEKTQARANIGAVIGTDVQAFSTSLTSLAGLTTAADRLPYTTAADAWAVTTLTAFARTILDDTNAAAVRTTIGLGNVDNTSDANKPISTATQTALDQKQNLDAMLTALAALTSANGQFLAFSGADAPVVRSQVGTVSQSGGIPTGAIFERGSNANGEYIRYADGTQICTFTRTVSFTTSAVGSIHRDSTSFGNWSFPIAFSANPFVVATAIGTNPWGGVSAIGTTNATIVLFSAIALTGSSVTLTMQATGRWF